MLSYKYENDALYIALQGHIDSANAAGIEAEIMGILEKNPSGMLFLDAEELEYISSAGLRIVLRLLKSGRKPQMINVSPAVYEILDVTGFAEMMPVQKAYRRISVEGCEIIGRGSNGEVYRLDPDTIVKLYHSADALGDIQREREIARKAFILGVPTAIPFDVVRAGERYGAVFELLNATSISKLIARDPENIDSYVNTFADLLRDIHAIDAKPGDFPDMKAVALDWAKYLENDLPQDQWKKLCSLIEAVPESNCLLHGDYHSNNVMVQNGEPLLIDMDTVCIGHPVFEFASVFNAYVGFLEADPAVAMEFLRIDFETCRSVWEKTLRRYFNTDDEAFLTSVAEKAMVIGYTHLLRRSLRREADTERGQHRIVQCKARLAELLSRIDTLAF